MTCSKRMVSSVTSSMRYLAFSSPCVGCSSYRAYGGGGVVDVGAQGFSALLTFGSGTVRMRCAFQCGERLDIVN